MFYSVIDNSLLNNNIVSDKDIAEIGKLLKDNQLKQTIPFKLVDSNDENAIKKIEGDLEVAKNDILCRIREKNEYQLKNNELQKQIQQYKLEISEQNRIINELRMQNQTNNYTYEVNTTDKNSLYII